MITFYGDKIAPNLKDKSLWNRFLEQHISNHINDTQHFTIHPQLDSHIFNYFKDDLSFKTFNEYQIGQKNLVIIGLHGGWTSLKLELIKEWFLTDANRLLAWNDPNCQIVLDYSEEGFTTEVFPGLWVWINENNLQDRVLYVSSSVNVTLLYHKWCRLNLAYHNMKTSWYGFFLSWIMKDRAMRRVTTELPLAQWNTSSPRYMCLNRRPHPHRILLITLLERYGIIEKGAVSMPKHFGEVEVLWKSEDFDIPYQWTTLKNGLNGMIDSLDNDFDNMYNKLPLIADTDNFAFNYALNINEEYYVQFPLNIISETLFFTESTFTSEKVWKPMLLGQLFLVMAGPYYLEGLRDLGFKTFSPYIDETYDTILDPVDRAIELVKSLKNLLSLNEQEFLNLLEHCQDAIQHNRALLTDLDRIGRLISSQVVLAIENYWLD